MRAFLRNISVMLLALLTALVYINASALYASEVANYDDYRTGQITSDTAPAKLALIYSSTDYVNLFTNPLPKTEVRNLTSQIDKYLLAGSVVKEAVSYRREYAETIRVSVCPSSHYYIYNLHRIRI